MTELNRWANPVVLKISNNRFNTSDDILLHPLWICIKNSMTRGGSKSHAFFPLSDFIKFLIKRCKHVYTTYPQKYLYTDNNNNTTTQANDNHRNRDRDKPHGYLSPVYRVYSGLLDRDHDFFAVDILKLVFVHKTDHHRCTSFSFCMHPEIYAEVVEMGDTPPVDFVDRFRLVRSRIDSKEEMLAKINIGTPQFIDPRLGRMYERIKEHLDKAQRLLQTATRIGSMADRQAADREFVYVAGFIQSLIDIQKKQEMFDVIDEERKNEENAAFLDEAEKVAGPLRKALNITF